MAHDQHDILEWLEQWYERHCDGDWEHGYGIKIDNVDNPGWSADIGLTDTELAGRTLEPIEVNYHHDTDWMRYWSTGERFRAVGGPRKLTTMLRTFRAWAETGESFPRNSGLCED